MNKLKKIILIVLIAIFSIFNPTNIIPKYILKADATVNPFGLWDSIDQTQIINGIPIKVTVNYSYKYKNFIRTVSSISSVTKSITDTRYKGTLVEFHSFNGSIITVTVSGIVYTNDTSDSKSIYGVFTFYI